MKFSKIIYALFTMVSVSIFSQNDASSAFGKNKQEWIIQSGRTFSQVPKAEIKLTESRDIKIKSGSGYKATSPGGDIDILSFGDLSINTTYSGKLSFTNEYGAMKFKNSSGGFDFESFDGNFNLDITDSGNISFKTKKGFANFEVDKVIMNGKVGIGTTDPKGVLHVKNSKDNILTLQSTDNTWLYTNWLDKDGERKAWVGFDEELSSFNINLENGANKIIFNHGNVGIRTTNPKNELSVNGTIWAKEVKVSLTDAADWVFEEDYKLRTLAEVEQYIKENKHLPEVPSAEEFKKNDLKVSEMTNTLLQKIEELTLYTIEQEKKLVEQSAKLEKMEALEERLAKLETLLK